MTKNNFKPMLAGKAPEDLSTLRYPVLVSPKLDGIRCIIRDGVAVSRTLKPIPNLFVQEELRGLPHGLDGELMLADPKATFNEIQSAIMSRDGEPNFVFWVFDWSQTDPVEFRIRLRDVQGRVAHPRIATVSHNLVGELNTLMHFEAAYVEQGYEGAMIRDPEGPYKYGRSTTKEGYRLKLKRFEDAEAVVIGAVERMHNENDLEQDNLGHAKRSHAKAGMVPAGDLGALIVRTPAGVEFEIGSGFTALQRVELWHRHTYAGLGSGGLIGDQVTYKFQPHGVKDKPRCPVFKGFRSD